MAESNEFRFEAALIQIAFLLHLKLFLVRNSLSEVLISHLFSL